MPSPLRRQVGTAGRSQRAMRRRLVGQRRELLRQRRLHRELYPQPHRQRSRQLLRRARECNDSARLMGVTGINSVETAPKVVVEDIQNSYGWSIISRMTLSRRFRKLGRQMEDAVSPISRTTVMLRNIGLLSAGVTIVTIGVMVGRELRKRYKFNRRTPYDAYSHSGDEQQVEDLEFGLGT